MLKLKTLVQSRNKFVCMQLVTMAQEQQSRVRQALETGDATAVQKAQFTYLSTLEASQELVAAAIFYPRASSKDGAYFPHMYVELICCCAPGKGYGTLLLQHIEQFVKQHHELLAEAFAHEESAAIVPGPVQTIGFYQPTPYKALAASSMGPQPSAPAAASPGALTPPGLSVARTTPQKAAGQAIPVAANMTEAEQAAAAVANGMLSMVLKPTPAAAPAPSQQQQQWLYHHRQQQPPPGEVLLSSNFDTLSISSTPAQPKQLLQGIKLLSVESAMAFYKRNGYSEPDSCHEMFKHILDL
jgi:hypothetical protein